MFNKTSLSNRNDSIIRKDVRSTFVSGSTSPAVEPVAKSSAATLSESAAAASPAIGKQAEESNESLLGARLIVGPDVKLKGAEILDCDTLVVEGRVEATMDSRVVRIADQGAFIGKVSIDVAEIHGRFEGELTARSQLIIHATGRVSGKIRYGKLVIDEGGELCGDVNSLSADKGTPAKTLADSTPILNAVAH